MSISPSIFTSVINGYLPEPQASLLNGILFGINLRTSPSFYNEIKTVGLLHLVVLSGTNITLLGTFIGTITSHFGKRLSLLITVLMIIMFIVFVGPKAPIVRAGIMGILTYVAILTGRKNTALYSVILSLIFIGVFRPAWLTSISLQLSYGATVGMIIFGKTSSKNPIIQNLRTTMAAQIFTTPLIFIYFKQVSLISPIANLLVAPMVTPLMIFGFLTAVLGKVNFYLGILFSYFCYGILTYMILAIKLLSKMPFAFYQFK